MKLERAFYLHTAPEGCRKEEGRQLFLCLFWFFFCRERKEEKGFVLGSGGGEVLFCFFLMQMKKRRKAKEDARGRFRYFISLGKKLCLDEKSPRISWSDPGAAGVGSKQGRVLEPAQGHPRCGLSKGCSIWCCRICQLWFGESPQVYPCNPPTCLWGGFCQILLLLQFSWSLERRSTSGFSANESRECALDCQNIREHCIWSPCTQGNPVFTSFPCN